MSRRERNGPASAATSAGAPEAADRATAGAPGAAAQDARGRDGSTTPADAEQQTLAYCLVPWELAPELHDLLRDHFSDDPSVEVIVERRGRERRRGKERRRAESAESDEGERRRIRGAGGRRVGERRAPQVPIEGPPLPAEAQPHAERITFVQRVEPASEWTEDLDTGRLVTRLQAGNGEEFTTLYTRYFDRIYGYLRIALGDPAEAEDGAQTVFMRVFEKMPEYERRRQPFRAWLFSIVRNQALDELRRRERAEPVDPAEIAEESEDRLVEGTGYDAISWITDRELTPLVEALPLAQRQVLVLRFTLDLSPAQTAGILGVSVENVRTLQSRALRFLRERLTPIREAQRERARAASR